MDNMNHLRDLLMFDIQHLYSAEVQIIEALPAMIAKASSPELKQALEQHLRVTEQQRERLDRVKEMMGISSDDNTGGTGIFASLFNPGTKSKGIEGLITDGEKMMAIDMAPPVMDAAIIGCSQKIEHFEICGYGTARTYAEQLGLIDVAQLLQQTLIEEHDADDRLTALAVSKVNQQAESGMGAGTNTMSSIPSNANM
jgi:ferritin-like metal-binding protein YciE